MEHGIPDDIEEHAFSPDNGTVHMPALLSDAFGLSRSEGRRLLAQAGVKLDGEPLDESAIDLPAERLDGAVLQVGRRRFKRLRSGLRDAAPQCYTAPSRSGRPESPPSPGRHGL